MLPMDCHRAVRASRNGKGTSFSRSVMRFCRLKCPSGGRAPARRRSRTASGFSGRVKSRTAAESLFTASTLMNCRSPSVSASITTSPFLSGRRFHATAPAVARKDRSGSMTAAGGAPGSAGPPAGTGAPVMTDLSAFMASASSPACAERVPVRVSETAHGLSRRPGRGSRLPASRTAPRRSRT